MILRRIIEHVKAQHWTAIVIDFVIVVAGVFIGIQGSNLNATRADDRALGKYLQDIAADVRSDGVEASRVAESARERIGASTYVLKAARVKGMADNVILSQMSENDVFTGMETLSIPDIQAPPAETRNRLWALSLGTYVYDVHRSAFDALISSGKIELVEEPNLMRMLRDYYYLVNAMEETQSRTILAVRQLAVEEGVKKGLAQWGYVDETDLIELVARDASLAAALETAREQAAFHLSFATLLEEKGKELLPYLDEKKR